MTRPGDRRPHVPPASSQGGVDLIGLLGVCPLLAAVATILNGLALGLATLAVLVGSCVLAAGTRRWAAGPGGLPGLLLVIAAATTVVGLACQALAYELHLALGIFLPLVAINLTTLCRAESSVWRAGVVPALVDALPWGAAMAALLIIIGGLRELLGEALVLAATPAGAFLVLALLVALGNGVAGRWRAVATRPGGRA